MKKYLYVLKIKDKAFLIFEDGKIKYFEDEEESYLKNLEMYLKDKINFKSLEVIKEKEAEYYSESYKVKIINIDGFENFIDDSLIKSINNIKEKDITYKDNKLLDSFFRYGFSLNNPEDVKIPEKEKRIIIKNFAIAAVIAILTAIFFMTGNKINYLGTSVSVITISTAAGGLYCIGEKKRINYLGLYFVIAAVLLSITYGIYTNMVFRVLNFVLIPLVLAAGLYLINYEEEFDYLNFIYNILPNITFGIFDAKPFSGLGRSLKKSSINKDKNKKFKEIQKGILISIPLLIILILLLSSADEAFGDIFKNIGFNISRILSQIKIDGIIAKTVVLLIVFAILYCFFNRLKYKELSRIKAIERYLDYNMVNTILIMVNVLYAFFTFVQLKSLYIKYRGNLTAGMYSDYAREGFFQLVIVVIINICIILIFENRVKENKLTRILDTIMTMISMSMTVSSMYKMNLYINKYGLTRLRFMTSIFMIFILVSLVFIAVSLWKKINLFKYVILAGSIFYIFINFANMDKCITSYNLNNIQGEIDVNYLSTLSKDSIDVMKKAYKEGKIDKDLYYNYSVKNKNNKSSKWFEYNYYNNKSLS